MDAVGNVLPQVIKDGATEEKGEIARLVTMLLFSLLLLELLQWLIWSKLLSAPEEWTRSWFPLVQDHKASTLM